MKMLLISDTHGTTNVLESLLHQYCDKVHMVCHMGDCARDLLKFCHKFSKLQMVAVAGNSDGAPSIPDERLLDLPMGKKILLLHGHKQRVNECTTRLSFYARGMNADAVFFGHTHRPEIIDAGPIFMMNPGSLTAPRGGSSVSYGLAEILDCGKIIGEVRSI